jgi:hypothetical protein
LKLPNGKQEMGINPCLPDSHNKQQQQKTANGNQPMSITSIKIWFYGHRTINEHQLMSKQSMIKKTREYTLMSSMHNEQIVKFCLYISRNLCHQATVMARYYLEANTCFGWAYA